MCTRSVLLDQELGQRAQGKVSEGDGMCVREKPCLLPSQLASSSLTKHFGVPIWGVLPGNQPYPIDIPRCFRKKAKLLFLYFILFRQDLM